MKYELFSVQLGLYNFKLHLKTILPSLPRQEKEGAKRTVLLNPRSTVLPIMRTPQSERVQDLQMKWVNKQYRIVEKALE